MMAQAPSELGQQSLSRKGQETRRVLTASSTVSMRMRWA